MDKKSENKCYNSWSCILSCAIILFIVISIVYDITVSKPQIRHDVKEIREKVQELNEKFDAQQQNIYTLTIDSLQEDSIFAENSVDK